MKRSGRTAKIKTSTINHIFKIFGFSKNPIKSIVAILALGITLGITYEETVGIGTWHNYHPPTDKINICFTPPSGCGDLIARQIAKAKSSIHVQAYGLTSTSIIHQLKAAQRRGVSVNILLDGGNLSNNKSIYQEFKSSSIHVVLDKLPGIAHNKVIIIDKLKTITGSFNFTNAADTKNAENVLLIEDREIAARYLTNWKNRKSIAVERHHGKEQTQ